jgi:FixJ family two-component response regulator
MKEGALDFLTKPVHGAELLERVQAALELDRSRRQAQALPLPLTATLEKLTPREREVLALALAGLGNKEIAARLGISLRTSEGHRSRIYLKTGVTSLLELVRRAADVGLSLADMAQPPAGA